MNILIFGASGSIGNYLFTELKKKENVIGTTSKNDNNNFIYVDNQELDNLLNINSVDCIIWCQGINTNDNIYNLDYDKYEKIIDVNLNFIVKSIHFLLKNNKINNNSKLIIISSIWEEFVRDNKLSYSISKSALASLVKSLAYDLSHKNILVNNILPGVIDNEMTQKSLSFDKINQIKKYLNFDRLITLEDIYKTVKFFIYENNAITGQSIKIDLGFTSIKKI